jgi:hypothetical protein
VIGAPRTCIDQLRALGERYGADELVFGDLCMVLDARKRCYELLAQTID